tara:strand:- start:1518 stop:2675 length:1158 start_codon:yes stop_codon:yes gene_type:complete
MLKFLRISSAYPEFLKQLNDRNIKNFKALEFNEILEIYFRENYSVSNNISKELNKLNYKCYEIINNFKILQDKWMEEFGDKNSDKEILIQQINFYKPDILFLGNAELAKKSNIDKIRKFDFIKLIIAFHCAPINKKIIENLNNVDGIITCTEGYKKNYKKLFSKNVLLMHHAFPENNLVDWNKKSIDISFIGSIFLSQNLHNNRVDLVYSIMKQFKNNYISINFSKKFIITYLLSIFGSLINFNIFKNPSFYYKILYIYLFSKKPIFGNKMYEILSKTKILLNTHIGDTEYAGNMRLFEGTGHGCMVITDYKKGLENLFEIGKELETFDSKIDLINKCSKYLNDLSLLKTKSISGQKRTLNDHTYKLRIKNLDTYINELLNEKNI